MPERRQGRSGAGDRLAHLLPKAEPAALPNAGTLVAGAARNGRNIVTRLATLEDEVAALTARVDALQTTIDNKLASHQDRVRRAVATLLQERR